MWNRKDLKTRAKAVLKISYWKALLVSILIAIFGGNSQRFNFNYNYNNNSFGKGNKSFDKFDFFNNFNDSFSSSKIFLFILIFLIVLFMILLIIVALRVFLGYPIEVGGRKYFIQSTQYDINMNNLGFAFHTDNYFSIVKAMLWKGFFNFLWYLLFIIPGIVKSYSYRMVPYILADNPQIGTKRALELSKKMTHQEKFRMFVLDLSFIGWYILGTLAFLIGIIFVLPYENATKAELYIDLRKKAIDLGLCSYEELNIIPIKESIDSGIENEVQKDEKQSSIDDN